ncbi:acyl carrier protein [Streptomyces sp. NPDC046237]|uniref:acyl carrier protein n=1 Tax=Streptomyces sp. NPDC046237 TaxID=3154914 RepID=UPI0033C87FE8
MLSDRRPPAAVMPPARAVFGAAASTAGPPDGLSAAPAVDVVPVLADVLLLKPEKIDPRRSFRSLGLDSLRAAEFVAGVNARYGTRIKTSALPDHPQPLSFARYVARELRAGRTAAPRVAPTSAAAGVAAVRPAGRSEREVLDVLTEELARILCCDPWDIDARAGFNVLGVDSVIGAEFVAAVNRVFGTQQRSGVLYDHPSPAALAAHIARITAPRTAPLDVEAVLDAVRDDLLTVDEALALLSRHG